MRSPVSCPASRNRRRVLDTVDGKYLVGGAWAGASVERPIKPFHSSKTSRDGAHAHPEDDIFYVIEGTMAVLVDDQWIDAPRGSFVLIPGGVTHNFENHSAAPAGALNFSYPGDFERHMPGIAEWFVDNPAGDVVTDPPGEGSAAR